MKEQSIERVSSIIIIDDDTDTACGDDVVVFPSRRCYIYKQQNRARSVPYKSLRLVPLIILFQISARQCCGLQLNPQLLPVVPQRRRYAKRSTFLYSFNYYVRSSSRLATSKNPIPDDVDEVRLQPFNHHNDNDNNNIDVASLKYLRWHPTSTFDNERNSIARNNCMELQTRVTTFQRYRNQTTTTTTPNDTLRHLEIIQLHGQFHFADDKKYYQYYTNDPNFIHNTDAVFYELLVDESLLHYEMNMNDHDEIRKEQSNTTRSNVVIPIHYTRKRKLKPTATLQASVSDEMIARQYHWYCQVNCMEYNHNQRRSNKNIHWYHADFTRQEFISQIQQQQQQQQTTLMIQNAKSTNVYIDDRRPLWQQAGSRNSNNNIINNNKNSDGAIVIDATTALLVGPPLIVQQQQQQGSLLRATGTSNPSISTTTTGWCSFSLSSFLSMTSIRRRIFTNLFLPGDGFAVWLRYILWITVPSPELSILLIDWSSTWGTISVRQNNGPSLSSQSTTNKSSVSPIALPLLQALSQGRFNDVRRLVFGQVALTGHHQATVSVANNNNIVIIDDENSLLITKRNDHALQQIFAEFERQYFDNKNHGRNTNFSLALLYGCNHCPDIHVKLIQEGFYPSESQWRTAWSVRDAPSSTTFPTRIITGASETNRNQFGTDSIGFLFLFLLPLYFLIGGYDWMETIVDVVRAFENNDDIGSALTILLFYVTRHVLLYLSLSKFVLDADSSDVRSAP